MKVLSISLLCYGQSMKISSYTEIELDMFRRYCNFVGYEKIVFELRSKDVPLEEIAERVDMTVDGIKKISRKVNDKILRVSTFATQTVNCESFCSLTQFSHEHGKTLRQANREREH